MLDPGTAQHSNYLQHADNNAIDALTEYGIGAFIQPTSASWTVNLGIIDKGSGSGWGVRTRAGNKLSMFHDGNVHHFDTMDALANGTTYHVFFWWNGTTLKLYVDAVEVESTSWAHSITANATGLLLLNRSTSNTGAQAALGHPMVYRQAPSVGTIEKLAAGAGAAPPQQDILEYWHKGIAVVGSDVVTGDAPTQGGTVSLLADDVDDYWAGQRTIEPAREAASRRLFKNHEPQKRVTIVNAWDALEAELMDPVAYSHPLAPSYNGAGVGVKDWQRARTVLEKQVIELGMPKVSSTLGDRRRFQATYREIMKLSVSGDPLKADGFPRLAASNPAREFSRASDAWSMDLGEVVKVRGGVGDGADEKFETKGLLIEAARTNYALRSSFVNQLTGWTKTETTGTATAEAATDQLLFDPSVSGYSLKITATAAAHDIDESVVTASLAASTNYCFSADFIMSTLTGTSGMGFFLQNDTTGNWLNADGSWTASRPGTALFGGAAIVRIDHTDPLEGVGWRAFTTESTASTHTIYINCTGTASGVIYRCFHVQIEDGDYPTSRIVAEDASVTRALDSLRIRNDSSLAQRPFPVEHFTVHIPFTPSWHSSDVSTRKIIAFLQHDANNRISVEYDGTNIDFNYVRGGTSNIASVAAPTLTKGTEYLVTIRKTSGSEELDEPADTVSVFLDGVKGGTEDTTGGDLTEATSSYLQVGALHDASLQLDGHIGSIWWTPEVFSDEEIAAEAA